MVHYEATHGQHCPYDNTIPSQQGPTIQPAWFWESGYEKLDLKPLSEILSELDFCNSKCANYLLNAAPNRDVLMDKNVVDRLKEVGESWVKPEPMTSLPTESTPNHNVVAIPSSGTRSASNVLDANLFSYWQADEDDAMPMITLDFARPETFNKIVCGEANNRNDVEEFKVEAYVNDKWIKIAQGEEMNFHWDYYFDNVTAQKYRLIFTKFKNIPRIAEITFVNYN